MRISFIVCFTFCFLNINAQLREALISDTSVVSLWIYDGDTSIRFNLHNHVPKGETIIYFDSAYTRKAFDIIYSNTYSYTSTEWYGNGQKKIEYPTPSLGAGCFEMNSWYNDGKIKATSRCHDDSCIIVNYYHSGPIEHINISTLDSVPYSPYGRYVPHFDVRYYENGQLKYDPIDANGIRQTIIGYYPSGIKHTQNDLWRMQYIGPYKEWFENGQLKIEGNYEVPIETEYHNVIGNKKTGKWTYYDESGKKIKEEFYEANKLINTITY